jgi:hypothetical protein
MVASPGGSSHWACWRRVVVPRVVKKRKFIGVFALFRDLAGYSRKLLNGTLAEREGFEPPIALRLCLISSQVHSTGLCHLSALCNYVFRPQKTCLAAGAVRSDSIQVAGVLAPLPTG